MKKVNLIAVAALSLLILSMPALAGLAWPYGEKDFRPGRGDCLTEECFVEAGKFAAMLIAKQAKERAERKRLKKETAIQNAEAMAKKTFRKSVGHKTELYFKINRKQWARAMISRLSDSRLKIVLKNMNGYNEKGNTFQNTLVFYDKANVPIYIHFSKRGVPPKGFQGYKTRKTEVVLRVAKSELDKIAYVRLRSDNEGNSNRIWIEAKRVVAGGITDGLKKVISGAITGGFAAMGLG